MKRHKGYIIIGVVCFFYWIVDSVWSYVSFERNLKNLIFSEPASYIDTFLLKVPPYQIVSRLMVVSMLILFGLLIIEFLIKRQTSEKERREAHDTFLTVLNSIDATIYVADMQSYEILFMNRYMIDSFGGDFTGQLCYRAFRNTTTKCDHCKNDALLDESGNPGDVVVWEGHNPLTDTWYINYDRAIKWVDGRIVHLQIATDITKLKTLQKKQALAESQLRQAQKMESIGTLAGGIAHDFNNILASIIGFTELALDDVERGSIVQDNLNEVLIAGKRARELVRHILAFARQSDETYKPIQVGTIAREVITFLRSSIPTTITIEQHINTDSLVMGNATQIHQILMNLCTNAAQAMDQNGGILTVHVHDVDIERTPATTPTRLRPGRFVCIMISDTGSGISEEIVSSIFEPYFTTKGPGEGTGMGLAMTHGIVDSHGGQITVGTKVGRGATFTVYLPTVKNRKRCTKQEKQDVPGGNERILFVDDEAPLAMAAQQILERLGYHVTTRTSSIEALELFRSKPDHFDLVITDMTMPNITGDDLATELIALRPDIPIILCTGYSRRITEEKAAGIGLKAFIYKPLVKAELAKTIRSVLDKTDTD